MTHGMTAADAEAKATETATYLGPKVDPRLRWGGQVEQIGRKATLFLRPMRAMTSVAGTTWGAGLVPTTPDLSDDSDPSTFLCMFSLARP